MKTALDVDGVLANFTEAVIAKARDMGIGHQFPDRWNFVTNWDMGPGFHDVWRTIEHDAEWWLSIKPHPGARESIRFDVAGYVTARPIPNKYTIMWLKAHGFPNHRFVVTVPPQTTKVDELKRNGIELFVDDNVTNFEQINASGIKCLLFDRPWNRLHDSKSLRISNLLEVALHLPKEKEHA